MISSEQSVTSTRFGLTQINHLNSALIVFSALIAWFLPFELFLFSYAVLGSLHYFTQISWMHDRNYFCPTKKHSIPLYLITATILVVNELLGIPLQGLIFLAFGCSALIGFAQSRIIIITGFLILIPLSQLVSQINTLNIIFAALLPSLIHVCIFTLLFMLYGCLKTNSQSGYFSVFVYLVCGIAMLLLPETTNYTVNKVLFNDASSFMEISQHLNEMLQRDVSKEALISTFRFMAFAYTYHYLNWFSKTKVINWHKISKKRAYGIITAWLMAIAIYAYDYKTGFLVILFFSMAHAILEFPLNIQCMKSIVRMLRGKSAKI